MKPPKNVKVRNNKATRLSVCISVLRIQTPESRYVAGAFSSCQADYDLSYDTTIYVLEWALCCFHYE
jgi:hypothetical protein